MISWHFLLTFIKFFRLRQFAFQIMWDFLHTHVCHISEENWNKSIWNFIFHHFALDELKMINCMQINKSVNGKNFISKKKRQTTLRNSSSIFRETLCVFQYEKMNFFQFKFLTVISRKGELYWMLLLMFMMMVRRSKQCKLFRHLLCSDRNAWRREEKFFMCCFYNV